LDTLVITALADQLLTPDRLATLLREAIRHKRTTEAGNLAKRVALQKELKNIETLIDRLYMAIADSLITVEIGRNWSKF
jgi:hypothetical protein